MADEEHAHPIDEAVHPGPTGEGATGSAGASTPDKVKQRRDAKIAIAVGIVGAVLAYLAYKRGGSSSSTTGTTIPTAVTSPAPATGTVAGYNGAAYNAPPGGGGWNPDNGAAAGTGAGPGETVGAPGTPGSAAGQPADIAAGYSYISSPQIGSNLAAAGVPIFVGIGGQNGPVVPFQAGQQYAPGSAELYKTGSAGGV